MQSREFPVIGNCCISFLPFAKVTEASRCLRVLPDNAGSIAEVVESN